MQRISARRVVAIALYGALQGALLMTSGCSPGRDPNPDPGGPDSSDLGAPGTSDSCQAGKTRCSGSTFQTCQSGTFHNKQTCVAPKLCDDTLACVDCRPGLKTTCVGDSVYQCDGTGSLGGEVVTCSMGQCKGGACTDDCGGQGTDLVYVVDENYDLLSFNPRDGKNEFKLIGKLDCPAGDSWSDWAGTGPATPFSMSVDRKGRAWVLYTSGEIFWVSTSDASCQKTMFTPGQSGFELFGMGFVSDAPGSTLETLFTAGGSAATPGKGNLGQVDAMTQKLTQVGALPQTENGPELTGTGNAELWGYYPGTSKSLVAKIDKTTGKDAKEWNLAGLGDSVRAWAFAHWGGKYYIFITTQDDMGVTIKSQVQLFDPVTGKATVLLPQIPYVIVGAGVSTCAPVTIG